MKKRLLVSACAFMCSTQIFAQVALGVGAVAIVTGSVAVGDSSTATGVMSTAIGYISSATATAATAVGAGSVASTGSSVALGYSANALAANSTAVGANAIVRANATNSVAIGNGSVASTENTVSVGSNAIQRTISQVAAGVNSTDATNLGQVQSLISAAALGGSGGGVNGVQYDAASKSLTLASPLGSGSVAITNLAPGAISASSTDAVNGSQLNATNIALATTSSQSSANTTNLSLIQTQTNQNGSDIAINTRAINATNLNVSDASAMATDAQISATSALSTANAATVGLMSTNILVARNTSDVVSAITSANNAIADASNASILANAVAVGLQNTSALVVVQGSAINDLASNLSTTNLVVADVSSVAQSAMTLAGNSVQYDASRKGATINGDLSVTGKLLGSNNVVSIGTNAVQIVSGSSSNGGADRITTDGAAPAGADLHLGGTTISSAGVIGTTPVNVQIDGNLIANNGVTVSAGTVVSMGGNKINNVASGVASTDAANVGQVNVAIGSKSGSVGTQNIATQVDSTGYATAAANSALTQSKTYTDSTVATINTNISSNITAINNVQNQVASIQSQTNQNTQDIYGLKQSLGSQQNQINNLNSGVAMAGALATARTAPITGGDGVYTSAGTAFYGGKSALSIGLVGVRGNFSINANVGYAPGANQNQTMISFGVSNKI